MEQKPTIDSIKKCKQDSRTLSLQETDNSVGVRKNKCSTFLSRSGLLAQGECWKAKSQRRNAVITFRDPKTAEVKGGGSGFCAVLFDVFCCLFMM